MRLNLVDNYYINKQIKMYWNNSVTSDNFNKLTLYSIVCILHNIGTANILSVFNYRLKCRKPVIN